MNRAGQHTGGGVGHGSHRPNHNKESAILLQIALISFQIPFVDLLEDGRLCKIVADKVTDDTRTIRDDGQYRKVHNIAAHVNVVQNPDHHEKFGRQDAKNDLRQCVNSIKDGRVCTDGVDMGLEIFLNVFLHQNEYGDNHSKPDKTPEKVFEQKGRPGFFSGWLLGAHFTKGIRLNGLEESNSNR